jgi:hypothetical protein
MNRLPAFDVGKGCPQRKVVVAAREKGHDGEWGPWTHCSIVV